MSLFDKQSRVYMCIFLIYTVWAGGKTLYSSGCASAVSGKMLCQALIKLLFHTAVLAGLLHHCPAALVFLLLRHDLLVLFCTCLEITKKALQNKYTPAFSSLHNTILLDLRTQVDLIVAWAWFSLPGCMTPLHCSTVRLMLVDKGQNWFVFDWRLVIIQQLTSWKFSVLNGNVRLHESAAIFYPRYKRSM